MKRRGIFTIVEFTNPTGGPSWRVQGTKLSGERVRKNFQTEAEADGEILALQTEKLNADVGQQLRMTWLTKEQLRDAEHSIRELGEKPIRVAVRFYLENYREAVTPILVMDAFAKFIEDKTRENARPDTIGNLKRKNAFLLAEHGKRNVHEVLPDQIKALIHRDGTSPVYRDNLRRAMSGFFNWCTDHGHCKESPLAKVKPIKSERDEPAVLPLAGVRKLLLNAAKYKDGVMLPYVAISLFAGVRPKELARLIWDDLDLNQKQITISGKAAKLRQRRIVDLSPNLIAWLRPMAVARRPFVGKNWRRDFDKVKELAGFTSWTIDIMRHTAISHHLAYHQHEGQTAQWAGNSPDVIQRHYKGLVNAKEAKLFWSIRPDGKRKGAKSKIVTLKAA